PVLQRSLLLKLTKLRIKAWEAQIRSALGVLTAY
ncbi:unnamed protein product, partial [marine sediment metagenome]